MAISMPSKTFAERRYSPDLLYAAFTESLFTAILYRSYSVILLNNYERKTSKTPPPWNPHGTTPYSYDARPYQDNARDGDILVHFRDSEETQVQPSIHREQRWDDDVHSHSRRAASKRSSRSYSARMSRQKSRKRDLLAKSIKPGITVDTTFTRHKGTQPRQVFPEDDIRSGGLIRKQSWFSSGRSSTRNKGLGITKGTPQPDRRHRANPSLDQSEALTAISMAPGDKSWQDISPWDRRIPIGISVPTDSVSDFSSYRAPRQRSGSDATLVTPNIVITPAEAMKSVWSPDTPFSGSDATPSTSGRNPFSPHYYSSAVPPVPALPAGVLDSASASKAGPSHNRNDTLDSAGTAFEEDDDVKRSNRIMSTGTVFEEDETPLTARVIEAPTVTVDTSLVPTPRRSQGWWNVITTPFVTTPNTAVFPPSAKTPAVPAMPVNHATVGEALPSPMNEASEPKSETRGTTPASPTHATHAPTAVIKAQAATPLGQSKSSTASPLDRAIASPQSAMSATPVVATGSLGAVLMPLQIEKQPRAININIELQDRRAPVSAQSSRANTPPAPHQTNTTVLAPAPSLPAAAAATSRTNTPPQTLPVFAPPPTHGAKVSHFSYDNGSRSSSPASTDLKGQKQKKHRKVFDLMACIPFGKKKQQQQQDNTENKKKSKKRSVCIWGCCCCLIFLVLLAIIIPLTVVLTRKRDNDKPSGTQPDPAMNSGWLNLPNYPPIPTGVSTVAQPEAIKKESGCVAPTTLWSCALPKELQDSVKPNKPDQPNFRIQITYQDGSKTTPTKKRAANPVSAGAFIRSRLLWLREVASPSPAPPGTAEMSFLGKTTDGNTAPFEGESTPLFITFQDAKKPASRLLKRAAADDPTNITDIIPPPMLESDGTAAAANLLPLPAGQPLRLYNRGQENEHYGFYTYFDRSIFLKQINGTNRGGNPADTDGGSPKAAANLRCTFSQTRFLVQIWTRSQTSKPLLQSSTQTGPDSSKRPGTFPYPITLSLDRHGGDAGKKNLYCYTMESDGTIKNQDSKKSFIFEDRGFGGNLVNGTQGRPNISGPIDGGSGGCKCQWQNWLG